jgi:hypothetical protein
MTLVETHDVLAALRVEESTFAHLMSAVEAAYFTTIKYHTSLHAADVLQALGVFISEVSVWRCDASLGEEEEEGGES